MIPRYFNLTLNAGASVAPVINVNQYDHNEQWIFTLFAEDGTVYTPGSGAIIGIKADGKGIINTGVVDSSGRVVINETQQMTAAPGDAVFELVIDNETHGTANFTVRVEPRPGDNAEMSESDIAAITESLAIIHSMASLDEILNAERTATQAAANASSSASAAQTSSNQSATAANSAETYRDEAKQYRDEASAIVGPSLYSLMVDSNGYIALKCTEGE